MTDTITIQLTITAALGAPRVTLVIPTDINASDLRKECSNATKIPLSTLKVIFRGRLIADDATKPAIPEFKLEDGCVLHCMGKPDEGSDQQREVTASSTTIPAVSMAPAMSAFPAPTPPNVTVDPLMSALHTLRALNTPAVFQTALSTLEKILGNIIDNPMEEKYRKVKKQNPAFQKRLGGLPGGDATMKAAGFTTEVVDGEEVYMLRANAEAWVVLVSNRSKVAGILRDVKSLSVPTQTAATTALPFNAGLLNPNVDANGVPNLLPPGMSSSDPLPQLFSDPNTIQAMMQNPALQSMLQNDPMFAGNPMMQNMLRELANNPQMAAQVSQMMQDPAVLSQIQQMRAMGGGPLGSGSMDSAAMMRAAQMVQQMSGRSMQPSDRQRQSTGDVANDAETTEEEMIAEAIRRSLQDS